VGPPGSILVVDDNREFATVLSRELRRRGYEVDTAFTGAEGLALVAARAPGLVFLDVRLPDISGTDVLARIREAHPGTEVVIMTGYPELASAMAAIRGRVADYLCKPFAFGDLDGLLARVRPSQGGPGRRRERSAPRSGDAEPEYLGSSPATARLRDLVAQLARHGFRAALVTGESGTGKELVARMLHARSPRHAGPFVAVNCSAVSEALFESEFFGHERGAFTGAVGARRGLVELAHRGTLFLDEVGDMPRSCQAKLLRFLDDQSFRRVGGERTIQVDVQVVAATNRDLAALVAAGEFREDLYFRLAVAPVHVTPLRQRPADVLGLAHHVLAEAAARAGRAVRGFSPEAEAVLVAYPWPGNVRELRNLVERLVILCATEEIRESDLPVEYVAAAHARSGAPAASGRPGPRAAEDGAAELPLGSLEDMERSYIRRVLSQVAGNKTRAAEILGISRQTLRAKLGPAG
jgi:DNA-binding NtrC family response regulator